jgi:1-aminocyclopropane-1-carboxylate deaminase/D-cysteine desulfhydrase-like pyridoxal-dependent ACC family enzyme
MTPWELRNGRWYKREDLLTFSNGVSGKVRTSRYLARVAQEAGATGLVYGGSVLAPALGRVASAAAERGMSCHLVLGSKPDSAVRHPTVRVAVEAGAELVHSRAPYNPALQAVARRMALGSAGALWQVPYGVSTPSEWSSGQVLNFLEQDADEVELVPGQQMRTLVISLGSGNAAAGMLYGLATRGHDLDRVVLVGVGPDRMNWLRQRLEFVGVDFGYLPELVHMPLHPHYAEYGDRMPETVDDIVMHPTYEGKVVRYLNELAPSWWTRRDGTTGFWIVGGPLP